MSPMYKYVKDKKVDRSNWPCGPWDDEVDFYEWTTSVGYPAFIYRLKGGALVGNIIAPYPQNKDRPWLSLAFHHTLRDKRPHQLDHHVGGSSYTDMPGIVEFSVSMEHYENPAFLSKRAPYKTAEMVKKICEEVAQDIFDVHKENEYQNYFENYGKKK